MRRWLASLAPPLRLIEALQEKDKRVPNKPGTRKAGLTGRG